MAMYMAHPPLLQKQSLTAGEWTVTCWAADEQKTVHCMENHVKFEKSSKELQQLRVKQKLFYGRTAKQLPPIAAEDTVKTEDQDGWRTKVWTNVMTENGQVIQQNRRSPLKISETSPEETESWIENEPSLQPILTPLKVQISPCSEDLHK